MDTQSSPGSYVVWDGVGGGVHGVGVGGEGGGGGDNLCFRLQKPNSGNSTILLTPSPLYGPILPGHLCRDFTSVPRFI